MVSLFRVPTPWIGHLGPHMAVTGFITRLLGIVLNRSFIPIVGISYRFVRGVWICRRLHSVEPYLEQLLEPVEVTINTQYSQTGFLIYLALFIRVQHLLLLIHFAVSWFNFLKLIKRFIIRSFEYLVRTLFEQVRGQGNLCICGLGLTFLDRFIIVYFWKHLLQSFLILWFF